MRPRSNKEDFRYSYLVNQQPVWFDVAFPKAFKMPRKFVISIFVGELFAFYYRGKDLF